MTARTYNIAFIYFRLYDLVGATCGREPGDVTQFLTPDMVELEYTWVCFTTVHTRVFQEIAHYEFSCAFSCCVPVFSGES